MAKGNSGQFKPGRSGNPGGRPRAEFSVCALMDKCVTANDWQQMFIILREKGLHGDLKSIELLLDRRFGKASQMTEITGKDGAPLQFVITERHARD